MANHYIGLTDNEVVQSRLQFGSNTLTPPKQASLWSKIKAVGKHGIMIMMIALLLLSVVGAVLLYPHFGNTALMIPFIVGIATLLIAIVGFFGGFSDPLFKILITAFVLSMGISIYEYEASAADISIFFEPIGIIVALLLATGVAYFLERSNEKTFQSLNQTNDDQLVKVIRNANVCQVMRKEIVVGDIVILETGEEVPADGELLEALNVTVNESSLTGEPSTMKTADKALLDPEATYPSNHILKGTIVMEGYCVAKIKAVGDKTESGKVFEAAQIDEGESTPLDEKLKKLSQWITIASYIVAALVVVGRIISFFIAKDSDFGWLEFSTYVLNTIMIAVTLIVVAVPEGLPMSVTLSLAFSMRKLMNDNTLPRTIHACETMGATSVICTDKTGTLTENQMRVAEAHLYTNDEAFINEIIAANTTANLDFSDNKHAKAVGNPTEGALLLWINDSGHDYLQIRDGASIVERLPFSTENKYMATVVQSSLRAKKMLYAKGAPEILMSYCNINEDEKQSIMNQLLAAQNKAMRTLAIAYREIDNDESVFEDGRLACRDLQFAGFFAISDPVRSDVAAAINDCINAGIQVKIITGDTSATAIEIGKQVNLWQEDDDNECMMTGSDFAAADDDTLSRRIDKLKILSRAKPSDKSRLVKLLKAKGKVVAVTGDGTNDAPALNAADVGLSMGDGTAVAKEASDMTIQDNSFATIAHAVMWGRSLYKNIQRFILFQMTINVVACLIVMIGAFIGTESPLTVTQMLWVNLIMDTFAAIALASLPPSHSVMQEKPRLTTDNIITKPMAWQIIGVGIVFTAILFCILFVMQHTDIRSMSDLLNVEISKANGLSRYELSLFFTLFVMLQFWNMFNAKAFMTKKSAFADIVRSRGFMIIALVILIGQIAIVELGGPMFNVVHIKPTDWLTIILLSSVVIIVGELIRFACSWLRPSKQLTH